MRVEIERAIIRRKFRELQRNPPEYKSGFAFDHIAAYYARMFDACVTSYPSVAYEMRNTFAMRASFYELMVRV